MKPDDTWKVRVIRQGAEERPVVVIDGFAADPQRFLDDAGFLSFRPMGEHYPGIRAAVAMRMLQPLLDALGPIVAETFGPGALGVADAFYSLVTTPPAALAPIQRLPHVDELAPSRLALLHYLSRDEASGTAFFRHRGTGFESIDAARYPTYRRALDDDLRRHGLPEPAYIAGDTPIFKQIGLHQGRFNRAILYRSNALHCAAIPQSMTLSADPLEGRLTVNTFLDLHA